MIHTHTQHASLMHNRTPAFTVHSQVLLVTFPCHAWTSIQQRGASVAQCLQWILATPQPRFFALQAKVRIPAHSQDGVRAVPQTQAQTAMRQEAAVVRKTASNSGIPPNKSASSCIRRPAPVRHPSALGESRTFGSSAQVIANHTLDILVSLPAQVHDVSFGFSHTPNGDCFKVLHSLNEPAVAIVQKAFEATSVGQTDYVEIRQLRRTRHHNVERQSIVGIFHPRWLVQKSHQSAMSGHSLQPEVREDFSRRQGNLARVSDLQSTLFDTHLTET